MKFDNTYELGTLIEHLQALMTKVDRNTKVTICMDQHLYDIRCLETTGTAEPELEHICDISPCICDNDKANPSCPYCFCPACNADEPVYHVYLMAGDQHPYQKPATFDSDEEQI